MFPLDKENASPQEKFLRQVGYLGERTRLLNTSLLDKKSVQGKPCCDLQAFGAVTGNRRRSAWAYHTFSPKDGQNIVALDFAKVSFFFFRGSREGLLQIVGKQRWSGLYMNISFTYKVETNGWPIRSSMFHLFLLQLPPHHHASDTCSYTGQVCIGHCEHSYWYSVIFYLPTMETVNLYVYVCMCIYIYINRRGHGVEGCFGTVPRSHFWGQTHSILLWQGAPCGQIPCYNASFDKNLFLHPFLHPSPPCRLPDAFNFVSCQNSCNRNNTWWWLRFQNRVRFQNR